MCGYIGIIWKNGKTPPNASSILDAVDPIIQHRGPDDRGIQLGGGFAVLHRRLSIIDVEHGQQPMISKSGTFGIAYNGEIYNYKILRKELEEKGLEFATDCDTEVFLAMYEMYGSNAFDMLDGMFTAFIWDYRQKEDGEFLLVRDHLGIKPLYLYEDKTKYVFCSEISPILALTDVETQLDRQGIESYLTYRYCLAPGTMFSNIRRIEAGTYARIHNGVRSFWRYWDLPSADKQTTITMQDAAEELKSLLGESVSQQQMSEVPVGLLLSGGLDSSVIAALCADAGVSLKSFNIGFEDLNEFEYSREVAEKFSLPHYAVVTSPSEIKSSFSQVVRAMDEPIADPACFPLSILCNSIKEHVTVVLSGEGSDELLGGYPQYQRVLEAEGADLDHFELFRDFSWYFNNRKLPVTEYVQNDRHMLQKQYFSERPLLNGMLAYDLKTWLPENLMAKADKITMSHSLEGRFPFLSRKIVEFGSNLPESLKLEGNVGKRVLREAFRTIVPESVTDRPKMGFSVPVSELLLEMKSNFYEVLDSLVGSELAEIVDLAAVKADADLHFSRKVENPLWIWTLYVLLEWFQQYFNRGHASSNIS